MTYYLGEICDYIRDLFFNNIKYLFHLLVIVLYPTSFYRFYFKYSIYPWNDFFNFINILIVSFLVYMAHLSYLYANKSNNPGYVEWDHFRTQENIQLHKHDK